jgi:hypothetical protein
VGRVAEQDHVAVVPALVDDGRKPPPDRPVGNKALALKFLAEEGFAIGDGRGLVGFRKAGAPEGLVGGLDDERGARSVAAGIRLVLVGVNPEEAVLVGLEVEGEGGETPCGPEPHEAVLPLVDARTETGDGLGPEKTRHTIGGHEEISRRKVGPRADLHTVPNLHSEAESFFAQNPQQRGASDAAETVAGRTQQFPAIVNINVVPMMEACLQPIDGGRVSVCKVVHGGVREHHAEAERVAGLMPLEQSDVVGGVPLLEQDGEVEGGGAGAGAGNLHARDFRSWAATSRCWISVVPS